MTVTMTPYVAVVTLVSLLLGIATQAVNSGKILRVWTVPETWMPWLMIVGPFLGGVSASLTDAHALTVGSVVNALLAGVVDVTAGAAPGVGVHLAMHAHVVVPQKVMAMFKKPANDNGTKTDAAA